MTDGSVLSNTDGVLFYIRRELEDQYRRVEGGLRFGGLFSRTLFSKVVIIALLGTGS